MKKIYKGLIISSLIISMAGCGKVATLSNGDDAVLNFKNGGISANELYTSLKEKYGIATLINMIDTKILETKYKDEAEDEKSYVNEQYTKFKSAAEEQGLSVSQALSAYYGLQSEEEFKELVLLSYRREKAVNEYLTNDLSEKEIQKYYDENIYGDIKASHILIKVEELDGMTTEEKQKVNKDAKAKAEEVIKKLNEGANFEDLVKEYSEDDTTNKDKGNLGWFNTDKMVAEFTEAAFKLKKNEYTKTPVKTEYGYHIILKTDEKDKPSLKSVKTDIEETLVENKLEENSSLYYKALKAIREDAGLKFEDDTLRKQYDTYMYNLIINAQKN